MGIRKFLQKNSIMKEPEGIITRKVIRDTKSDLFDIVASDEEKNQEKINIYGLSQKEIDMLLTQMLLQNTITDGNFLYAWDKHDTEGKENGATKFSAIAHSPLYTQEINANEKKLFKNNTLDMIIDTISRNKKTHIELGPESWEKFIRYSDEWDPEHRNLRDKKYIGVDVSGVYVDMANKNVEKIGMVCESVPGDRFKHSIFDKENDQIYYFFGGSIGNLDVWSIYDTRSPEQSRTIINLLKRMKSNTPFSRVPAVITYFEAPEENDPEYQDTIDKLMATYGAENTPYYDKKTHDAAEDFILSWLEALGLERSNLELAVTCEKGNQSTPLMIKCGARFKKKTEIKIGGYKIVKEEGEYIRAIKSQRFTQEMFEKIANDAGFMVKYQKSRNGVAVAVLQSKLWMNDKFKKIRNISYGIMIGSILLGWWMLTKNILHHKEVQHQQKKMDTEFVSKQKMAFYGTDHGYYELKTDAEKIKYIDELTDQIFENIALRYHVETDKEEIKKIIRSYIKDKEILGRFSNTTNYTHNIFELSDAFTKKYSDILLEKDIDTMPYAHLKEYEIYFNDVILDPTLRDEKKTRLSGGQGTIRSDDKYLLDPRNNQSIYGEISLQCIERWVKRVLVEDKLFPVEGRSDVEIKLYLGNRQDVVEHSIKDGYLYIKRWKEAPYNYVIITTIHGDETKEIDPSIIAYDYFYQNRPIIHEIYKKLGAIYGNMSEKPNREKDQTNRWKKVSIKMLITKDLLSTWDIDSLDVDDDKAIIAYLQEFIKRNTVALQEEWIAIAPYASYEKHSESCKNTFEANGNDIPKIITYEERQKYDFQYIGKYYTQSGDEYDAAEVTIWGKKYVFGRKSTEDGYKLHTQEWKDFAPLYYYLEQGKEMMQDYFNLKI